MPVPTRILVSTAPVDFRKSIDGLAAVVEVAFDAKGELTIPRVDIAIDCGPQINPDRIESQLEGACVETIEGISASGEIADLQEAFVRRNALQCGYCTPGMLMSAHALLAANPEPNAKDIRKAIQGNLCRCTGYQNIFKAIEAAATELRGDG